LLRSIRCSLGVFLSSDVPVKLTPEEEEIRRLAFPDLTSRKVLQILSIGARTTVEIGERMLERGKSVEAISVIVRGKVRVTRDDGVFAELVPGQIVGSALLLSGVTGDIDAVVVELFGASDGRLSCSLRSRNKFFPTRMKLST